MAITFTTTVLQEGNNTGIEVPEDVVAALGKGRGPKVIVTVKDYTWRGTVQVSSGRFMLSLSAERREAAGLRGGERVNVTVELDLEPRTVEVPDDLKAALSAKAGAFEAFEALAFSKRKEFVRQVEEAKALETRNRRIAGIVAQLGDTD